MKTIQEIKRQIDFPRFTDMFGNEVMPGDIIGMTSTASRQIDAYFVTNTMSAGNNIILLDIMRENGRGYLNINELRKETSKHWQTLNIVKLNESLPQHLKEKAVELKNKYFQKKEEAAAQAIINRKNAVQTRFFPILAYDKSIKQLGVIFMPIKSMPGKVISSKDIQTAYADLNKRFPKYVLNIIDKDGALSQLNKKVKPELFSFNRSMWHYGIPAGIDFNVGKFADSWELTVKENYDSINKFIKINKHKNAEESHYGIISKNQQDYYIENVDPRDCTKNPWINMKYCATQEFLDRAEAFEKYYA